MSEWSCLAREEKEEAGDSLQWIEMVGRLQMTEAGLFPKEQGESQGKIG